MVHKCKHFEIHELVPPSMLGIPEWVLWRLFDDRALITLDALRERYGRAIVNDYKLKGVNKYRGFRPDECPIGSEYSQHRFGRAFDVTFDRWPQLIRYELKRMSFSDRVENNLHYITRIEKRVPWLHFDVANKVSSEIHFFSP